MEYEIKSHSIPVLVATGRMTDIQTEALFEINQISDAHRKLIKETLVEVTVLREKIFEIQGNALFRVLQTMVNQKEDEGEVVVAMRASELIGQILKIRSDLVARNKQE